MKVWASAELLQPASAAVAACEKSLEPLLNASLARSALSTSNIKIRYVPIVMPKEMHLRYPERTKIYKKKLILDCAPHLVYDVFIQGDFDRQIKEYARGIALSASLLSELGLTTLEIADFLSQLSLVVDTLVASTSSKLQH